MSMSENPPAVPVTYTVISQTPTKVQVPGGTYVNGTAITAQTANGDTFTVLVPDGPNYVAQAQAALQQAAAQKAAVAGLTS